MTLLDIKSAFAMRIQEVCTARGIPIGRGRASELSRAFKVTPNAARKWLLGQGLPELEQAIAIALWGNVHVEWLLTGRGPKSPGPIPTESMVLDDMLRSLPARERHESIAMLRYEVNRSSHLLAREQAARYEAALDHYDRSTNFDEASPSPR